MNKERLKVKCIGIDEEGKGIVKLKGKRISYSKSTRR